MKKQLHRYAGVLLISDSNKVVAQQRDDKPGIDNPGKVSTFGGTVESNERPLEAAIRELEEETNLSISADMIKPFMQYEAWRELTGEQEELHFFIAKGIRLTDLEVYEGQGYYIVTDPNDPHITENSRPVFRKWFEGKT